MNSYPVHDLFFSVEKLEDGVSFVLLGSAGLQTLGVYC